jgi:hypothetical protein
MKVDTQLFISTIIFFIFAGVGQYFHLDYSWIFLVMGCIELFVYIWHVIRTHEYTVQEMAFKSREIELKQYETFQYWEIAKEHTEIISQEPRKVGF